MAGDREKHKPQMEISNVSLLIVALRSFSSTADLDAKHLGLWGEFRKIQSHFLRAQVVPVCL